MPSPTGHHLVIAIDGPAGAGKSTVARGVARALGIAHLDTGAMYRAVTARLLDEGGDPADPDAAAGIARGLDMDFTTDGLTVDGRAVGIEIRTPAVDRAVSEVSAHAAVRSALVEQQRRIMEVRAIVAEGRDIGTVVYPDAPVKIFLTASIAARAERRHAELAEAGHEGTIEALRAEIERRDALDSSRSVSPLTPAPDAILLDTTSMTAAQVIDEIAGIARRVSADV